MSDEVEDLWKRLCEAEDAFYAARMALFASEADFEPLIDAALPLPYRRGTALRLLEILPEVESRRHLASLVSLASVGHASIGLVRSVILRIDREWLLDRVESHVLPMLDTGGEEEYRRIAELYEQLGGGLLAEHLSRCAKHADADVREIASDSTEVQRSGSRHP